MKSHETGCNPDSVSKGDVPGSATPISSTTSTIRHRADFIPVLDSRKRRIAGLYQRNDRYYVQMWADRGDGKKTARRFPLLNSENEPVRSLVEAKEAIEVRRHARRENELPLAGRKPLLDDYSKTYFEKAKTQRKRIGRPPRLERLAV